MPNTTQNLEEKAREAEKQYKSIEHSIEESVRALQSKSVYYSVVDFFFNAVWLAVYAAIVWFSYKNDKVDRYIFYAFIAIVICFFICILIEDLFKINVFKSVILLKARINKLKSNIDDAMTSINTDKHLFLEAERNGWALELKKRDSFNTELEQINSGIARIKIGNLDFIGLLKNFFYFALTIATSIVGSIFFYDVIYNFVLNIADGFAISDGVLVGYVIVVLVIAIGVAIFLAYLLYTERIDEVDSVTIFATLSGPIAFLILGFILAIVIYLVAAFLYIAFYIIAVILGGALLLLSTSNA